MSSRPKSLRDLLSGTWDGVLVPIVQRDFAQGRPEAKEVRERFLRALHDALDRTRSGRASLDLDFVYGYRLPDSGRFVPIDGQQRLTTLFLLHWYLATQDEELEHFRALTQRSPKDSRFQYAVRPSSDDFFLGLTGARLKLDTLLPADHGMRNHLSRTVRNEHWFYRSWDLDPTVRACLTMLDAIHEEFAGSTDLYHRLVGDSPAVTFQFLDLDEFGLGDELYIKMNARGRALTSFEVFKSELEKFVRAHSTLTGERHSVSGLPLHEHIGVRFDTTWSGLIWTLLREEFQGSEKGEDWTRLLDPQLLNLVRTIAIVSFPVVDAADNDEVERALEALHNGSVRTFRGYLDRGAASDSFVRALITLLDCWSGADEVEPSQGGLRPTLGQSTYYDEVAVFRTIRNDAPRGAGQTTKPKGAATYTDVVRFAAYCLYLLSNTAPAAGLAEWMRVTCNLARNTPIEKGEHLRRALVSIRELLDACSGSVLRYLANGGAVRFFLEQQVREEQLKAQLIHRSAAWRSLIERGETHPYFEGQIEFLFAFCGLLEDWLARGSCDWPEEQDESYRASVEVWLAKAEALFAAPGGGLVEVREHLWECALLCEGDYLLAKGSNWSLLQNSDRDVSWKRLLRADMGVEERWEKRDIVRRVLERLDPEDLEGSLRAVVADGAQPDKDDTLGWRRRLVQYPSLLDYCLNRWIRWAWDGEDHEAIYLLHRVRRGRHRELYTWHLGLELKDTVESGQLAPFTGLEIPEFSGSAVRPGINLVAERAGDAHHRITFEQGRFHVYEVDGEGESTRLFKAKPSRIVAKLKKLGEGLSYGEEASP